MRHDFDPGIVGQRAQNEERVLGLDAVLLDLDLVVGVDAMTREECADVAGSWIFGGEKRVAEFLEKIAVDVEVSTARIDQHASGIVVEEEWQMHALSRDFNPLVAFALAFPLPNQSAVVVTRTGADGRNHGVRPDREAAQFDHSHGGAANLGEGRVEDKVATLQQAEALNERKDAGAKSNDAPELDGGGRR